MLVADGPYPCWAPVRVEILQLLQGLQKHLAIIYITHDLSTVRHFSERPPCTEPRLLRSREQPPCSRSRCILHKALFEATSDPDAENLKTFKDVPAGEPPSLMNPPTGCRFNPLPEQIKALRQGDSLSSKWKTTRSLLAV